MRGEVITVRAAHTAGLILTYHRRVGVILVAHILANLHTIN